MEKQVSFLAKKLPKSIHLQKLPPFTCIPASVLCMKSLSNIYFKSTKCFLFLLSIIIVTEMEALQGIRDILSHGRTGKELNDRCCEGENGYEHQVMRDGFDLLGINER